MSFVCVLDMDETQGVFDGTIFHLRPKLDFLLKFLFTNPIKIVLWSMGDDSYVQRICNGFLPKIVQHADVIFARRECLVSDRKYQFCKAPENIRTLYSEPILLMVIEDCVKQNMDELYDLRIQVKPYREVNPKDAEFLKVVKTITDFWIRHVFPGYQNKQFSLPPVM